MRIHAHPCVWLLWSALRLGSTTWYVMYANATVAGDRGRFGNRHNDVLRYKFGVLFVVDDSQGTCVCAYQVSVELDRMDMGCQEGPCAGQAPCSHGTADVGPTVC